jgi:pimeloyl-ACP methyl ester carboxylesterase
MTDILLIIPGLDGDPRLLAALPWPPSYESIVFDHSRDAASGGVEGLVERALELVDARYGPHASFVLCGESFGSTVALTLARRHPRRVRGLLLLSAFGWYPWPNRAFVHVGMATWRLFGNGAANLVLRIGRVLSPLVEFSRTIVDYSQLAEFDLAAYRTKCDLVLAFDARPWLAEVRCRTLIVGGRLDLVVPAAAGRTLAQSIPSAELRVLAGGHIAHLSRPERLEPVLSAWLGRLALSRAADFEGAERLDGFVPIDLHVADVRPRRTTVAPADHVLDSGARPLENGLDAT